MVDLALPAAFAASPKVYGIAFAFVFLIVRRPFAPESKHSVNRGGRTFSAVQADTCVRSLNHAAPRAGRIGGRTDCPCCCLRVLRLVRDSVGSAQEKAASALGAPVHGDQDNEGQDRESQDSRTGKGDEDR